VVGSLLVVSGPPGAGKSTVACPFAHVGFVTVYDGLISPWFVTTFGASTGFDAFDHVVLLPPVDSCVQRVMTRQDHGFRDEDATRKMHNQFVRAAVDERQVLVVDEEPAAEVAAAINAARVAGAFRVDLRCVSAAAGRSPWVVKSD
jgi:hypothetical protein